MPFQILIYITLLMVWMFPLSEANAEDSIVNQYDANGNLISGDGKYYEYNDANQLVRVREKDTNGALVSEYFYDYTGQRVKKVENGVTTYYPDKHYETQVVQGQVQNTSYYFADGDRVAKMDATGISFYHPDHLGGISAVTNTKGQVVSSTSYLPFGEVRQGGIEKYSYTGKEKDKASDLYNFEARYVSPELRHFTQADIADPDFDDPQDLNRYAYVGNNPLSYVDPDGYKKKKKAKLSKREKWMIAHGVDPDHDKTTLKKAKKLEKAGKKYTVASKTAKSSAGGGQAGGGYSSVVQIGRNLKNTFVLEIGAQIAGQLAVRGVGNLAAHSNYSTQTLGKIGGNIASYIGPTFGFAANAYDAYNDTYNHPERDIVEDYARATIDMTATAISGVATCLSGPLGLAFSASYSANREDVQDRLIHNSFTDYLGQELYDSAHDTKFGGLLGLN